MTRPELRALLTLTVMLFLSACAGVSFERVPVNACPPWPVAGPAVAGELARLPSGDYPHTWEWLARLDKLRQQLDMTRDGRFRQGAGAGDAGARGADSGAEALPAATGGSGAGPDMQGMR
jgi:hypothetical protein